MKRLIQTLCRSRRKASRRSRASLCAPPAGARCICIGVARDA